VGEAASIERGVWQISAREEPPLQGISPGDASTVIDRSRPVANQRARESPAAWDSSLSRGHRHQSSAVRSQEARVRLRANGTLNPIDPKLVFVRNSRAESCVAEMQASLLLRTLSRQTDAYLVCLLPFAMKRA
jgi:hypothetical protein